MNNEWQLQDAKNRLSELVEDALQDGPQCITRRGKPAVVVLSAKDYERLKRGKSDLVGFFHNSPLRGVDIERMRDFPRQVDL